MKYPTYIIVKSMGDEVIARITKSHKLYPHTYYGVLDESGSFPVIPIRNLEKALKVAKKNNLVIEYC